MVHRYKQFYNAINLTADYVLLNISLITIYNLLDNSLIPWMNNKNYLPVVLVFNLLWLLSSNITSLYNSVSDIDLKVYQNSIRTYLLYLALICTIILLVIGTKTYFITKEYLFYSMSLFGILLGAWKVVFFAIRKSDRVLLSNSRKAIIVGASRAGTELYNQFNNKVLKGYEMLGFFDDEPSKVQPKHLYLGNTSLCMDYVLKNNVDEIFCALPYSEHKTIERLMSDSDKNLIRFKIVPEYHEYFKNTSYLQNLGNIPILSVRAEPLENILNRALKRAFDIVFSLMVIIFVLSWLFPILAILIKLESKGPIFFTQMRSGRDNHAFKCYKFRSMRINKDKEHIQATLRDPRITKVGTFLRKTSLDELPQFINVLIGNMSVVGPRPHMLSHTEQYSQLIDQFMVRHFMKPGITGWAQINGLRGETKTTEAMLERVEADVWYLENWTFLLDLKIVMLTVWKSIAGDKNAY
ncbi:MAG: undecaprenyl-phosphate glucose phosphotransferase [Bacteroidetes bacterium]|nr:undecaprenyl-phosphate glucose phosphotransferase [Bacteroidota bacterium]